MASSYFYLLKIMPFPSFNTRNVGQYILTLLSLPSLNIEHHFMKKYITMLKRWEKKFNRSGVEYILLNAKRRKRHYFQLIQLRTGIVLFRFLAVYSAATPFDALNR